MNVVTSANPQAKATSEIDQSWLRSSSMMAGRFPSIDIAVLFTGAARVGLFDNAPLTLTAEMAAEVAAKLPNAKVFPVHSEGWAHFSEDRELLEGAFAAVDARDRLFVARPGERVLF